MSRLLSIAALAWAVAFPGDALAADLPDQVDCDPWGRVTVVKERRDGCDGGGAFCFEDVGLTASPHLVIRRDGAAYEGLLGGRLCVGDTVETSADGVATVRTGDANRFALSPGTTVELTGRGNTEEWGTVRAVEDGGGPVIWTQLGQAHGVRGRGARPEVQPGSVLRRGDSLLIPPGSRVSVQRPDDVPEWLEGRAGKGWTHDEKPGGFSRLKHSVGRLYHRLMTPFRSKVARVDLSAWSTEFVTTVEGDVGWVLVTEAKTPVQASVEGSDQTVDVAPLGTLSASGSTLQQGEVSSTEATQTRVGGYFLGSGASSQWSRVQVGLTVTRRRFELPTIYGIGLAEWLDVSGALRVRIGGPFFLDLGGALLVQDRTDSWTYTSAPEGGVPERRFLGQLRGGLHVALDLPLGIDELAPSLFLGASVRATPLLGVGCCAEFFDEIWANSPVSSDGETFGALELTPDSGLHARMGFEVGGEVGLYLDPKRILAVFVGADVGLVEGLRTHGTGAPRYTLRTGGGVRWNF